MNIKQINEILSNLENPTSIPGVVLVKDFSPQGKDELSQGEYNEKLKIYQTPIDGVFLSLAYRTDSYNENESIYAVQFVAAVEKSVTEFETI